MSFDLTPTNRHKFNAKRATLDGQKFDSQAEKRYAERLEDRKARGEVLFWHRQVQFRLPGNTVYKIDFQEFHADGTVHYIDVKGKLTDMFIMKKKQVEALYPVTIEVVK